MIRHTRFELLFFCLCSAILASCSSGNGPATNSPTTPDSLRFPTNAMFERGNGPSLNGWTFHPSSSDDTAIFQQDAPTGGTWCLELHKADTPNPTNRATQSFTNLTTGIYELTAWTKMKYSNRSASQGWIGILRARAGASLLDTMRCGDSVQWHPLRLFDTLLLLSSDTVTIELSAAVADTSVQGNAVRFDDVTFRKVR
ncbi:MAG: hypothetical protein Q8922_15320 [Bacteroidota bacterium]|nr:hypothetical protein [Bacteroidota bacterium]MDP4232627.1 hypothetical protein [Bacteroidota bacterium]MDP4243879.1 hypothetical protein [Bacteroidota bacterium]MDP4289287.1 hypothetical protein [Bacteroidota bacterium]